MRVLIVHPNPNLSVVALVRYRRQRLCILIFFPAGFMSWNRHESFNLKVCTSKSIAVNRVVEHPLRVYEKIDPEIRKRVETMRSFSLTGGALPAKTKILIAMALDASL